MQRRVKLDFKPLSLAETAQHLGVPQARARKILAMIGVNLDGSATGKLRRTSKYRTDQASSPRTKTRAR
jgi:hypothetical protein